MSDSISAEQLRLFIERIERLEEEKKGIADDIKDVYAEAKSTGFDAKTMRTIVRLRKMEKHHRDEADMLLETYRNWALASHKRPRSMKTSTRPDRDHGRPFQIQEHHAPQGRAG
jgi:uncharacterized protein (UPF0335 family)